MSNFFERFLESISNFGEITDAHMYHYNYINVTVRGNDKKTYEFTVSIDDVEE